MNTNTSSLPVVLGGKPTWAPIGGEVKWDRWGGTAPSWDKVRNATNPNAITWPVTGEPEARALSEVALSGAWAYNGPFELALRERMAERVGVAHYLTVANGSVALTIALAAAMKADEMNGKRTKGRPEVVTTALSFNATPLSIALSGLTAVMVEVERDTLVPSVAAIEAAITANTRVLLIPAMYAAIPDLAALRGVAKQNGLWLIVDGAHAPFGRWEGRAFTAYADIATASYQLGKDLTGGEGGAVYTNDDTLAALMDMVRNVGGKPAGKWVPKAIQDAAFRFVGYNQRLADPQAALVLMGTDRYPAQLRHREEQYRLFIEGLAGADLPFTPLRKTGEQILYKVGLYNETAIPTGPLMVALRQQLTGEVNAPYGPLCCPASGYTPETAQWQFGHLGIRRGEHFANAHFGSEHLMMFAHDFWLRRDAADHALHALTVVSRHERELVAWASRQK